MQCFVILISDQTMPNLTFLSYVLDKQNCEFDLILLTTKLMQEQKKVESILMALDYKGKYKEILIESENLQNNIKILDSNIEKNENVEYIVNITCGNKIMFLSVYLWFSGLTNALIYYLPINSNAFTLIYPIDREESFIPEYLDSIELILKSYNIDIKSVSDPLFDYNIALNFYLMYKEKISSKHKKAFLMLRNIYHSKNIKIKYNEGEFEYPDEIVAELNKIEIDKEEINKIFECIFEGNTPKKISTAYIDYISGGWFEEYIYYNLKQTNPQDIMLNVKATNLLNNEFDVFMLKNNVLYFIECKTSVNSPNGNIINETLYKLDSLSHPAGLTVKKFLICLDEKIFEKEFVKIRAKQTRIQIVTGSKLNPEIIKQELMRL
ncbi:MAG: DUF1887 family CARF protein [Candidatus Cloacimonetes bacterium]|nr:DUF1887 family CARF protein [Candidatus Cloacimonadota bacterium]MDD4155745.1 DUF1887 family CARF protein [Candidatus Cloacimonadota bacterium]